MRNCSRMVCKCCSGRYLLICNILLGIMIDTCYYISILSYMSCNLFMNSYNFYMETRIICIHLLYLYLSLHILVDIGIDSCYFSDKNSKVDYIRDKLKLNIDTRNMVIYMVDILVVKNQNIDLMGIVRHNCIKLNLNNLFYMLYTYQMQYTISMERHIIDTDKFKCQQSICWGIGLHIMSCKGSRFSYWWYYWR